MEEKVVNEEIKEEVIIEEEKSKVKFIDKLKSKKTLIGVGLAIGAGLLLKAVLSSKNEENDGVVDVEYTEVQENDNNPIEYHEDDSVESSEKSE